MLNGARGRMGRAIASIADEKDCRIVAGVDLASTTRLLSAGEKRRSWGLCILGIWLGEERRRNDSRL